MNWIEYVQFRRNFDLGIVVQPQLYRLFLKDLEFDLSEHVDTHVDKIPIVFVLLLFKTLIYQPNVFLEQTNVAPMLTKLCFCHPSRLNFHSHKTPHNKSYYMHQLNPGGAAEWRSPCRLPDVSKRLFSSSSSFHSSRAVSLGGGGRNALKCRRPRRQLLLLSRFTCVP